MNNSKDTYLNYRIIKETITLLEMSSKKLENIHAWRACPFFLISQSWRSIFSGFSVLFLTAYIFPFTVILSQTSPMIGWIRKSNHVANSLIKKIFGRLCKTTLNYHNWGCDDKANLKIEKTSLFVITPKASLPINRQNSPLRNYCALHGLE